jgi:hypothetical protein
MTSEMEQQWNTTISAWVNYYKSNETYNSNNYETSETDMMWNTTTSAWMNYYQNGETYDANNFEKSFEYKEWNADGTKVTLGDSIVYYFHTVVGINELATQHEGITVYPNPASNNITIESPQEEVGSDSKQEAVIEITNIQGQLIKTLATSGNKTNIDVSVLPSGVYVIEVRTEKGVFVNKFIKE